MFYTQACQPVAAKIWDNNSFIQDVKKCSNLASLDQTNKGNTENPKSAHFFSQSKKNIVACMLLFKGGWEVTHREN